MDDNDSDEPRDGPNGKREGILGIEFGLGLGSLTDLLSELEQGNRRSRTGRIEGERGSIDYDYSVESLSDGETEHTEHSRTKRLLPPDDYLVDYRYEDDELVVIADLPGVAEDDLSLAVDRESSALVLGVGGESVERIPLSWREATVTEAAFNNEVLEVHLRRGDDE